MSESGDRIDLLVLGGGMAGLSAAAYASAHGASVVVVEKAPAVGGSAAYAGYIHTPPTLDVMREVNPGGDP
jgi:glycine/D-amino acid oxidase-like deaminating enzyme